MLVKLTPGFFKHYFSMEDSAENHYETPREQTKGFILFLDAEARYVEAYG
jgi:hypothetical protein